MGVYVDNGQNDLDPKGIFSCRRLYDLRKFSIRQILQKFAEFSSQFSLRFSSSPEYLAALAQR